jgi:hypothetical protein
MAWCLLRRVARRALGRVALAIFISSVLVLLQRVLLHAPLFRGIYLYWAALY